MSAQQIWTIKNRLSTINNITDITQAMNLVASIKLKRFQKTINNIYNYHVILKEQLKFLINDYVFINKNRFIDSHLYPYKYESDNKGKEAYIIFASNVGLCGNYNDNILNVLTEVLKDKDLNSIDIYMYGKYGQQLAKDMGICVYKNISNDNTELTYKDLSRLLTDDILKEYINEKYNQINVIYTKYNNIISQQVCNQPLLPLNLKFADYDSLHTIPTIVYESNPQETFNYLIKKILKDLIYIYYLNARISEESLRHNSMSSANDNGKSLQKKLKHEYNMKRQAKITQEMNEITRSVL